MYVKYLKTSKELHRVTPDSSNAIHDSEYANANTVVCVHNYAGASTAVVMAYVLQTSDKQTMAYTLIPKELPSLGGVKTTETSVPKLAT